MLMMPDYLTEKFMANLVMGARDRHAYCHLAETFLLGESEMTDTLD